MKKAHRLTKGSLVGIKVACIFGWEWSNVSEKIKYGPRHPRATTNDRT